MLADPDTCALHLDQFPLGPEDVEWAIERIGSRLARRYRTEPTGGTLKGREWKTRKNRSQQEQGLDARRPEAVTQSLGRRPAERSRQPRSISTRAVSGRRNASVLPGSRA